MDTNLLAQLIAALVAAQSHAPVVAAPIVGGVHPIVIATGMVLAGVAPIIAAVAAWFAQQAARNTEHVKAVSTTLMENVEKVHVAVNSERTAMLEQIRELRDEILRLSKDRATLEEQQRERGAQDVRRDTRDEQRNTRDEQRDARDERRYIRNEERRYDRGEDAVERGERRATPSVNEPEHPLMLKLATLLAKYEAPLVVDKPAKK